MHAALHRRRRRARPRSCFPLATSSRLETPRRPPHPFHPPWTSSPSPLREFVDVRKLTGAHHRRNRGHLPPQPLPPCPEQPPSSSSSLGASNRSQELRGRRHLHQLLAGAAARFRRFLRRRDTPACATTSTAFRVSLRVETPCFPLQLFVLTGSAMDAVACRRHGRAQGCPCAPSTRPERAFNPWSCQLSNACGFEANRAL